MRFATITATVARTVVNVQVRTIFCVESFAYAMRLHSWLRMSLGLSSDPCLSADPRLAEPGKGLAWLPTLVAAGWLTGKQRPGDAVRSSVVATVPSCPAGPAAA